MAIATFTSSSTQRRLWQYQKSLRSISTSQEEGEMYARCDSCYPQQSNSVAVPANKNALSTMTPAADLTPAAENILRLYLAIIFYARGEMFSARKRLLRR
jgi:hypothetical protein